MINLSIVNPTLEEEIFTLPQSTVLVPEGQTQAAFPINAGTPSQYASADIRAVKQSDSSETLATVSVRPPLPDLTVIDFTVPESITPNVSFQVTGTVQNIGPVGTGSFFSDRVYFSLDDQFDPNIDEQIGFPPSQPALESGAQRNLTANATIWDYQLPPSNQFYLIYLTNDFGVVDEGDAIDNNYMAVPMQIGMPDVLAENLTVPEIVEPNVNYTVSWDVRNAGNAATSSTVSFVNRLYFSFDEVEGNEDDIQLLQYNEINMAAGESRHRSTGINIPTAPAHPSGSAMFYVKADVTNTVLEGGGEDNNTTTAPTQFDYRVADLEVMSTSAPAEVETDTEFALEWTTINNGNKAAGGFQERVYFSTDDQVGGDVLLATFPFPSGLAPEQSVERIQNVTIPTSAITASGYYWVYVQTDWLNQINEGEGENNNIRWHPIFVRRLLRPDLTVTNITAPETAFFDQTIQVQWTVTNTGLGPTDAPGWKDAVYLNVLGNTVNRMAEIDSVSALNPGESYVTSATIKIPRGYNGTYQVVVRTDTGSAVNDENRADNTLTRTMLIEVPPLPDLVIANVQAPPQAVAGGPINIRWTVENIGDAPAVPDPGRVWQDRIYLSTDEVLNTSQDRLIFTSAHPSPMLPPNSIYNSETQVRVWENGEYVWKDIHLPSNIPSGTYYVFAVTDVFDGVYEFNAENNNTGYDSEGTGSPMPVTSTPFDLVITDAPTAPDTASGGESINVAFTVKNQGAFDSWGGWKDGLFLSADETLDQNDTLTAYFNHSDFAAGEQKTVERTISMPYCVNGTHYLIAKTDYGNAIPEFDPDHDAEANNESPRKAIELSYLPPDLAVTNIAIPEIIQHGQTFDMSWTVTNNGTGPATGNWHDRVLLVSNAGMGTAQLAYLQQSGPLAAGDSYTRTATVTLPQFMQGEYYIAITTDYNNSVSECGAAEQNNTGQSTAFSLDSNLPDLVIQSIDMPVTTIQAGTTFQLNWTGVNQGAAMGANIPGWVDKVYLSTDQTLWHNDPQLGSAITQIPLMPGQTYQKELQLNMANVAAGNYYILILADANGNVYEGPGNSSYEANNLAVSIPITVTSPGVDLQAVVDGITTPTFSGQTVNLQWTVTNHGDMQTSSNHWTDYIILSRDSVIDATDPIIGWRARTGFLTGGEGYTVNHSVVIPAGLTGVYRIFIHTDRSNHVIENNEANNISPGFDINLELPPPADLSVTHIGVPASGSPGDVVNFQWTVQNAGPNTATGPWRDSIYLSRDQFWDAGDILLGQRERTGSPLGVSETEDLSRSFRLPSMEEGDYYVIVRTDSQNRVRETNEANNVQASLTPFPVGVHTLTLGEAYNTTLEEGSFKSFKFIPGAEETALVTLTGEPGRDNDLYTKALIPVNLSNFEFQGSTIPGPNKENFVPLTEDGPYYSMVANDHIPQNLAERFENEPIKRVVNKETGAMAMPHDITIKAEVLPFSIHSVSPNMVGNGGVASFLITGAKFDPTATVKLVGPDDTEVSPRVVNIRNAQIRALFDLKDKPAGAYSVVVTNPNEQTAVAEDSVSVVNGGGHSIRESLVGPPSLRFGTTRARYTFSVNNDGLNDAQAVPFIISLPEGMAYDLDPAHVFDIPEDLLPDGLTNDNLDIHRDIDGRRYVMLMVPLVPSRSSVNIGITLHTPIDGGFQIGYGTLPPLAELVKTVDVSDNGIPAPDFSGFQMQVIGGSDLAPQVTGRDVAACWGEALRSLVIAVISFIPASGCADDAAAIVLATVDYLTSTLYAGFTGTLNATDAALSTSGFLAILIKESIECVGGEFPLIKFTAAAWTIGLLIKQILDCIGQTYLWISYPRSFDPNEIIGPEGYGPERFVAPQKPLVYRINFENLPDAAAPAQRIYVTDILPPELDPRTVRLQEIGFNHQTFVVPDNRAFYTSRVDFDAGEETIKADIFAGLDIVNRRITWTLTAIDPNTGELPLDPLVGLLPPNNEDRDGEGYVTFTVEAYGTFPNRTPISNFATIIFDENEPIVTNTETNLLDSVVPSSQIEPLPPTSETPEIPISWSGTDDADGSGFEKCDIYVSENGGSFLPVLSVDTLVGSGVFTGKWGTTYGFYSVCADNAGNVEPAPLLPDAEIAVLGGAFEGDVAPRPNGDNDGVVSTADLIQSRRFVAGLDTDLQYNEFQRADTAPLETGGDGELSVADLIQSRRFAAGLDAVTRAAGPLEQILPLAEIRTGKNSDGLGELRQIKPVTVSRTGDKVTVGIVMEAQGDEVGVGFTLQFDPSVIRNPANITLGSDAAGMMLTTNTLQAAQGRVGILLDKDPTQPLPAGTKRLVTIEFDIVQSEQPSALVAFVNTPIRSEVINGLAQRLTADFTDTVISLTGPTAAEVSVSGRVLTSEGRAISNARVTFRNSAGGSRTVNSNGFGHYRIPGLMPGEIYVIEVKAKGYSFQTRTLRVDDEMAGVDLIAD